LNPSQFFTEDHRACDSQWAALEAAADAGRGEEAKEHWSRFDAAMRRHYAMEEEVLFPAIESVTGMVDAGPTAVMRGEHQQMRGLLDQMGEAAAAGDFDSVLDQGDTLLMLIQQHNVKEEGILYPLADRMLTVQWPALRERLADYAG